MLLSEPISDELLDLSVWKRLSNLGGLTLAEQGKRRPPHDAFDVWLHAVVDLIIEPILDVARTMGRMIRRRWQDTHTVGGISRSGSGTVAEPWVYPVRPNRGNCPVNYVGSYDTLRFANWMHNGQGSGDTEDGAYDMSLGTSVVRKPGAQVFLPSENEWYKAAYH